MGNFFVSFAVPQRRGLACDAWRNLLSELVSAKSRFRMLGVPSMEQAVFCRLSWQPEKQPNRTNIANDLITIATIVQKFCRKSGIFLIFSLLRFGTMHANYQKISPEHLKSKHPKSLGKKGKTLKKWKELLADKTARNSTKARKRRVQFCRTKSQSPVMEIRTADFPMFPCLGVHQKAQRFPACRVEVRNRLDRPWITTRGEGPPGRILHTEVDLHKIWLLKTW